MSQQDFQRPIGSTRVPSEDEHLEALFELFDIDQDQKLSLLDLQALLDLMGKRLPPVDIWLRVHELTKGTALQLTESSDPELNLAVFKIFMKDLLENLFSESELRAAFQTIGNEAGEPDDVINATKFKVRNMCKKTDDLKYCVTTSCNVVQDVMLSKQQEPFPDYILEKDVADLIDVISSTSDGGHKGIRVNDFLKHLTQLPEAGSPEQ